MTKIRFRSKKLLSLPLQEFPLLFLCCQSWYKSFLRILTKKKSRSLSGMRNNQRTDSPESCLVYTRLEVALGTKNLQKYHPYTPKAFYFSFIKPQ